MIFYFAIKFWYLFVLFQFLLVESNLLFKFIEQQLSLLNYIRTVDHL